MENYLAFLNSNSDFTSLKDLELEKKYKVTNFEIVETKYGPKLLVTLDNILKVILPDRFTKKFTVNQIEEMNSNPVKFTLIYIGMEKKCNGYSRHLVTFE